MQALVQADHTPMAAIRLKVETSTGADSGGPESQTQGRTDDFLADDGSDFEPPEVIEREAPREEPKEWGIEKLPTHLQYRCFTRVS